MITTQATCNTIFYNLKTFLKFKNNILYNLYILTMFYFA